MTIGHDHGSEGREHDRFDAKLRFAHAQAVEHVSPRMFVQLRPPPPATRTTAGNRRLHAWPLAATCAIALVAGGLFLRHPVRDTPAVTTAAPDNNEPGDVYAALDESPELYLWLASNDTDLVAE